MSCAGVTVAVLPDVLAQASAAVFTAAVSASPDEAIRICSEAGPDFCVVFLSNPLPQAAAPTINTVASAASATDRGCGRFIGTSLQGAGGHDAYAESRTTKRGASRSWSAWVVPLSRTRTTI